MEVVARQTEARATTLRLHPRMRVSGPLPSILSQDVLGKNHVVAIDTC